MSADIAWVDPGTESYYLADRSNSGVDIIDAENDVWVGRVGGMAGPLTSGGGTATTNGPGPNGVLVTPNRKLWAGDGNSLVQVADVDPNSPSYLQILHPGGISTSNSTCDNGSLTGKYCGRADELGYDPKHHLILVANNGPLSPTKLCPTVTNPLAHCAVDPYATLINADFPYNVLGQITFPGAGGLEQPLWDSGIKSGRFLLTVPGKPGGINPFVAVIDPTAFPLLVESSLPDANGFDCLKLTGAASASTTGIALGPFQHLLVSACGYPIILNALTGHIINTISRVGGGDEVWYNPGDGRFYVTGTLNAIPASLGGVQQLGVIDAETSTWLQDVPDVKGKNPAAFPETNHVFTVVSVTAAILAAPATDDSVCATFGFKATGCIAVFTHSGEEAEEK